MPALSLDAASRRWALVACATCILPLLLQLPMQLGLLIGISGAAVAALSWRRPLSGWVRVVLAVSLVGIVLGATDFRMGRDTGCALLGAMLAIKPAETFGLRDARSLIGFSLFAPFATFLLDQGPLTLAMGMVAAMLSLGALQRFAELESGDVAFVAPVWRRLADIGRLVAIGLPLALATFWLFPRLGSPLWGVPERAMARPGLSDQMSPGEWIDLMSDDTPALRVRFLGATPRRSQMYWRGPVLWDFDGRNWTQPRWMRGLPPAATEPATTRWD